MLVLFLNASSLAARACTSRSSTSVGTARSARLFRSRIVFRRTRCESSGAVSSMDLREQDAPMRARDCYQTTLAYPLRRAWAEGLPSDADDVAVLEAMVAAGCRDGCSQRNEATVDGLPFEDSLQINRALKEIFLREPE